MPNPRRKSGKNKQDKITSHFKMEDKDSTNNSPIKEHIPTDSVQTPCTQDSNKRPLSSPENAETGVAKALKPGDMNSLLDTSQIESLQEQHTDDINASPHASPAVPYSCPKSKGR